MIIQFLTMQFQPTLAMGYMTEHPDSLTEGWILAVQWTRQYPFPS